MKKLLLFVSAACIFSSCTKTAENESENPLLGNWELRNKTTGLMPTQTYPPGNGNILKLNTADYAFIENGIVKKSGRYISLIDGSAATETCSTIAAGEFEKRIIFMPDTIPPRKYYHVTDNTLKIIWGCAGVDGKSIEQYERIAN
jgi:hypothetical protein